VHLTVRLVIIVRVTCLGVSCKISWQLYVATVAARIHGVTGIL